MKRLFKPSLASLEYASLKAEQYKRAKSLFEKLVDATDDNRRSILDRVRQEDPGLATEVESLLNYHTAQSLVAPAIGPPKIRTRSTLSTTYQVRSSRWLPALLKISGLASALAIGVWILNAWSNQQLQQALERKLELQLTSEVDDRLHDFRQWEAAELSLAAGWGRDAEVLSSVKTLIDAIPHAANDPIQVAQSLAEVGPKQLSDSLQALINAPVQFIVWDRRMIKLAQHTLEEAAPGDLGAFVEQEDAAMLAPVLKGAPKLLIQDTSNSVQHACSRQLSIAIPIVDEQGHTIAACAMWGYGIEERYRSMLHFWNRHSSGEVYLVNAQGWICSPSRYIERLRELNLIQGIEPEDCCFPIRDPGVNLLQHEPTTKSTTWPTTLLAREIALGNDGSQLSGYRNYVGELVVGAWRWMPDHDVGIATEQSYDEAFGLLPIVSRPLLIVSSLLSLAIVGMFAVSTLSEFRRRKLRDISEVGPYQIVEILGEGGMGRVYLAEHALLCRQSAVKVLTKGDTDLSVLSRFEREVQLASQLTHPNTIAIYDFGRNRDGIFYYAMEYIDGAHLGQLSEYCGALEPGRCIWILQQLCRALAEAHQAGVVHRDIKPQNIMVCNRGGEPDFVKLFDYGLVKAFAPGVSESNVQTKVVVGTPRFMAPERLDSPWLADPRVDVYSVGAVAYFLLTGKLPPLVIPGGHLDSEQPGIETLDLPPAVVAFGGLLSHCLSLEPASRPSSMFSLLRELDALAEKFPWSREDSEHWWQKNGDKLLHLVRKKRKKLE